MNYKIESSELFKDNEGLKLEVIASIDGYKFAVVKPFIYKDKTYHRIVKDIKQMAELAGDVFKNMSNAAVSDDAAAQRAKAIKHRKSIWKNIAK